MAPAFPAGGAQGRTAHMGMISDIIVPMLDEETEA